MSEIYCVQVEPGKFRYFAGKKEATSKGRNFSSQVDHIVPVYACELLPNTTRLEGIVHALNGEIVTTTKLIAGYKRGRSAKGWADDTPKKTAETLGKLQTVVGQTP